MLKLAHLCPADLCKSAQEDEAKHRLIGGNTPRIGGN
jgi:hypothetical protein